MDKIRWGIVGPGEIANKFARAIKNVECAELCAVASRSEENGKAFAKKYDIGKVFVGYEEMAKSDAVDAVYIATPHPFHKPCAEIFLNAQKHVLCEKPICVNAEQARSLCECAKKNNVFLMEAMWTRFLPAVKKACEIVKRGEIGEILGISADFCYASSPEEEAKLFINEMAGGSLLDVGVYCLHFVSLFLGNKPSEIAASAWLEYDVDSHTNALLKYPGGAIASVSSATKVEKLASAYIYGSSGHIYMQDFYKAQGLVLNVSGEEKYISAPSLGEGFEEEIYEVCNCIAANKTESDVVPFSDSIEILEIMDKIREKIGVKYPFDVR